MRSVKQAVRLLLPVLAGALTLLLSGCSVLGYFMTPDWVEDADLIVVNQNETPVYAITVSAGGGSETTADAGGDALLEIAFDDVGTKRLMLKSAAAHMEKL